MKVMPKIIEFTNEEKNTLIKALNIINEFENKTAYQLEFEDEHNTCWGAKEYLEEFLINICDIEI